MLKSKDIASMNKSEIEAHYLMEQYNDYCNVKENTGVRIEFRNQLFEEVYTISNTLGYSDFEVLTTWDRSYISKMAEVCCTA